MNTRQRKMVGHGSLIMLFGLLAGIALVMKLIGGFEVLPSMIVEFELPATERAWARTHAGGLMNGLMVYWGLKDILVPTKVYSIWIKIFGSYFKGIEYS